MAYARNKGIDIRIARFHNIFGIEGTYKGGREKAPAAMCRKVIEASEEIEVWGAGDQTRSFLYIDECIEGVMRLMESDYTEPINIGSDESISIQDLAKMAIELSGKDLTIKNIDGPIGVNGRNSDNTLIEGKLNWKPSQPLIEGIAKTFNWIQNDMSK
jgi:nucleoside-diphosphate-sugar epimerase